MLTQNQNIRNKKYHLIFKRALWTWIDFPLITKAKSLVVYNKQNKKIQNKHSKCNFLMKWVYTIYTFKFKRKIEVYKFY